MSFEKILKFGMIGFLVLLLLGCFGFWAITPEKGSVNEGSADIFLGISVLSTMIGGIGFVISVFSWLVGFIISRRRCRN
jgi:heme/copper-type cytochrome/quinol oxidase subunit 2